MNLIPPLSTSFTLLLVSTRATGYRERLREMLAWSHVMKRVNACDRFPTVIAQRPQPTGGAVDLHLSR